MGARALRAERYKVQSEVQSARFLNSRELFMTDRSVTPAGALAAAEMTRPQSEGGNATRAQGGAEERASAHISLT